MYFLMWIDLELSSHKLLFLQVKKKLLTRSFCFVAADRDGVKKQL